MSKSLIVMVLIATMAAGNALPLWAESVKKPSEKKRLAESGRQAIVPLESFTMSDTELETVGLCDLAYELALDVAAAARAVLKAAALIQRNDTLAAAGALRDLLILIDPLNQANYINQYMQQELSIQNTYANALLAADSAYEQAVIWAAWIRDLCKAVYS